MKHIVNLVSVFNYGITAQGDLYFTMEWAQGEALDPQAFRSKPAAAIPVVIQMCRALAYLHARGVIHGDLKPGNVLMAEEQVKLVDFGVALEARSSEARSHYYTPGYTAPEVKEQRPIDHRIDLYSLGALWYALIVGEPPMFMLSAERLIQFALEEALEGQGQIPIEISAVIARLLASTPTDRYASANEVIEAINRVMGSTYTLETRETAGSYALRAHFVDRETEFDTLKSVWKQAQSEAGKLMLISGEAGVGKTRLLEEFVVQAEMAGAFVARGQCVEIGGAAYRPWREVLRVLIRYVESASETTLQRVGPVLAALLPELWERPCMAGLAQPADLNPHDAQRRLNDNIVQVLRAAAEIRPTVVVIEDTHRADEATLTLLTFLAHIPKPIGLLVCLTYHDDETSPEHPLAALLGSGIERIALRTLPPEITADLARLMLGLEKLPPLLMERIQQVTGGNAFFTQELIRTLAEDGVVLQRTVAGWRVDDAALQKTTLPGSIRQVVEQRLTRLPAETQRVLRGASIIGSVFWAGAVAEITQITREKMQAALSEGVEKALLVERGTTAFEGEREYMFVRSTVREVSYESILHEERRELHHRVAAWLRAHREEEVNEQLGLIAHHLEKAGQTEQAVDYLRRAGQQAAARFANAEAIDYLSRALNLTPEDDWAERYALLLTREKMYDLQGAREAQHKDLAALEELTEALDDNRRRAEVALRKATYCAEALDAPATIAAAQVAVDLAHKAKDVQAEAEGYRQWGEALWHNEEVQAARRPLEQALNLAQAAGARVVEAGSLRNLGSISNLQGDFVKAKAYNEQALRLYRETGYRQDESRVFNNLAIISMNLGNYPESKSYLEEALRVCREIGYRRSEISVLNDMGLVLHYLGDDEASRQYQLQALTIAEELDEPYAQGHVLTCLGHALASLGRLPEAVDAYRQALTLRHQLGQHTLAIESLAGLASVTLAQGDPAQALTHIEEILSYLKNHTLDRTEEPFRVYVACYRVLQASQDPRAQDILDAAYHLLQERAAKIADDELRRSFLENVAIHREIENLLSPSARAASTNSFSRSESVTERAIRA